jgi:hypothetical protein
VAPGRTSMRPVRILVLWNACRALSSDEDARWVREEVEKLVACLGVRRVTLHKVASAAIRYPRHWDWCLEVDIDATPNAVIRAPVYSEFLADLRLLGTKPAVLVLPEGPT